MHSTLPLTEIGATPRWFAHAIEPNQDIVLMVERSEAALRAASFLDDRSIGAGASRHVLVWNDLASALPAGARRDAHYIFHIGHVGSTLISRLLGEHPSILALREPMILRTFFEMANLQGKTESPWAPEWLEQRLPVLAGLLSRTFRPDQRAMVKATSFTSEIAHRVVQPESRALLVYASPESYVANILAGDASRQELHFLAGTRLARLERRLGEAPAGLWDMSVGQKAAMAWACEMSTLAEAAERLPEGVTRWCDFDQFLSAPGPRLAEIAAFFGHALDADSARKLVEGPLMSRYSKGPEYEYSPRLRSEVLSQSMRENEGELRLGMDWLSEACARFPAIAACMRLGAQR